MKKKIVTIISSFVILMIVLSYAIAFNLIFNRPVPSAMLYVDPQTIYGVVGQNFTVYIRIFNVTDLYGWQVRLSWNTTILDVVDVSEGTFLKSHSDTLFNWNGSLLLFGTLLGEVSGVNGSGVLATLRFRVKASGECGLQLSNSVLGDSSEQKIAHTVRDGRFST